MSTPIRARICSQIISHPASATKKLLQILIWKAKQHKLTFIHPRWSTSYNRRTYEFETYYTNAPIGGFIWNSVSRRSFVRKEGGRRCFEKWPSLAVIAIERLVIKINFSQQNYIIYKTRVYTRCKAKVSAAALGKNAINIISTLLWNWQTAINK